VSINTESCSENMSLRCANREWRPASAVMITYRFTTT
jgi:hypothetical protein